VGLIGQLVAGRYRIGPVLGTGGLCVVYGADDITRGRPVAIKVLPQEKARDSDFAQRFRREVAASQRIDHPGVVAVYDSGALDDGGLYLVMERLDGLALSHIVEEGGALDERRALGLTRQILLALDAAHRQGFVHRDVKPKNVMIIDVGGIETVKLFDFGIASNERAAIKLTMPGVAFGTPGYISPEMAKGERVDARADVYSVGVTLFELVTGRLPFRFDDELDLVRAHLNVPPPPAREARASVSAPTERLILRAMQKSPDARCPSAREMIDEIDAILKPARPRRRVLWIAAAAAVAAAAALAAWLLR
jgi:eukaryotic-like serine/threonine-protein kinase